MIKFLPLDLLSVSHRIPRIKKNKNAVYSLQISPLVPEMFKFVKWVKYADRDDITRSTQYYIEYISRATLANLQCRTLKLGRLIVLQKQTYGYKKSRSHVPLVLWNTFSRILLQRTIKRF